jgi:hypothetical protein
VRGFTAIPATCPSSSCTPLSSAKGFGQAGSTRKSGTPVEDGTCAQPKTVSATISSVACLIS